MPQKDKKIMYMNGQCLKKIQNNVYGCLKKHL